MRGRQFAHESLGGNFNDVRSLALLPAKGGPADHPHVEGVVAVLGVQTLVWHPVENFTCHPALAAPLLEDVAELFAWGVRFVANLCQADTWRSHLAVNGRSSITANAAPSCGHGTACW